MTSTNRRVLIGGLNVDPVRGVPFDERFVMPTKTEYMEGDGGAWLSKVFSSINFRVRLCVGG